MIKVVINKAGHVESHSDDSCVKSNKNQEVILVDDSIPHLQLRVAWAYGATIEISMRANGVDFWKVISIPPFYKNDIYRIKPSNPNADEIKSIREAMLKLEKRLGELS